MDKLKRGLCPLKDILKEVSCFQRHIEAVCPR